MVFMLKWRYKASPETDLVSADKVLMRFVSDRKTSSQSDIYSSFFVILFTYNTWKDDSKFSSNLGRNSPRVVRHAPIYASCLLVASEWPQFFNGIELFWLNLIVLCLSMTAKIFTELMPNAHLKGLGCVLWSLIHEKARSNSFSWSTLFLNFINMSSTYASMVSPITWANNLLTILW